MDNEALALTRAMDRNRPAPERREAFGKLVCRYQDSAFATAYAILHDRDAAQDAALEAFLEAWRKLSQLRDPAAFPVWLRTLVRSRALRHRRLVRPIESIDPDRLVANVGPTFVEALDALQTPTREAVILAYVVGLSREEIAAFTGVSEVAIKKRLERGRARLREEIMDNNNLCFELPSNDDQFRRRALLLIGRFAERLASRQPILLALDDCITEAGAGPVHSAFQDMRAKVRMGLPMSDAMRQYPNLFEVDDVESVFFGEERGLLDQVFARLAGGERLNPEILRLEFGA